MKTRHQIEAEFASALATALKVNVEVTLRGGNDWTVCGSPSDVSAAVAFLTAKVGMKHERTDYDDELGESFAYLAA